MISFAAWLALCAPAAAADVSIDVGDDISALTSSLRPGDRVLFAPGTYELENTVEWIGVGTEEEPITIKPNGDGEVIFSNLSGGYGIRVVDSAFMSIDGLTIEGTPYNDYQTGNGIEIENSSNITLVNSVFRNLAGDGIRLDGDCRNLLVEANEVANLENGTGINIGCGDASCWTQDSVIVGNLVHDTLYSGIYLQPGTQNVELYDNNIFRVERGVYLGPTELGPTNIFEGNAIWQTEGDGITIEGTAQVRNNVVFETGSDGIYTNNNDRNGLVDVVISHNTVARTDGYGANLDDAYQSSGFVFSNNVLSNPTGYGLDWDDELKEYGETTNYISNNVVTGLVEGYDPLVYPTFVVPGGGFSDFENADNFDFYPSQGSTMIDRADAAGDAYIPEVDFNGVARDGASPDVGAYEWDGAGNPGWVIAESFKETDVARNNSRTELGGGCCSNDGGSGDQGLIFLPLAGLAVALRRRKRKA